jgi:hypothetical protein
LKKKNNIKKLKDKAWKVFSRYIRERDKFCVTCLVQGKETPATQAGHFWHGVLDFDEENINGQCVRCNHFLSGNLAVYAVYLISKLGTKGFNELSERHYKAMSGVKMTEKDYIDIINKYGGRH